MNFLVRRFVLSAAFVAVGAYSYFTLRGPQGIPALMEKRRSIRQIEEENANLARENELRKKRLEKFQSSPSEQDRLIREKLKKLQEDDTEFVLPGPPDNGAAAKPAPEPVQP